MPWAPKEFQQRHNKALSIPQARRAASMAEAMIKSGVDEGIAIATANKRAKKGFGALAGRKR